MTYVALRNLGLLATLLFGAATWLLWSILGPQSLLVILPLIVGTILILHVETARHSSRVLKTQSENLLRQIQAIFSLNAMLSAERPLPLLGKWAIDPDFALLILTHIFKARPRQILELGSGASTLIAGLALKEVGGGHILSMEHDSEYGEKTTRELASHDLACLARVVHCPLKETRADSQSYFWYDIGRAGDIPAIDMLIVDGPPGKTQSGVRFPAIPMLYEYLSDDAVIFIDDCKRKGERSVIERWREQYDDMEFEFIDTEKGAYLIRKKPPERIE